MDKRGHYPSPNFECPPPNSIQLTWPQQQQQQPPRTSSFHHSMWTWNEGPSESGWWNHGAASGNTQYSYGQSSGHEWYQAGYQGYKPTGNHGKRHQNKREPEFLHFCDTCDRGFKNQEKYEEHVAQHVKCSVPDCSFTAHEKIVSIHWRNTHAPGKKRIKLDTPEEIAKWREERRRNYPTADNVERKKKLMAGREQTGAVLETAQFGRMRGRGRRQWRGRGHQGFRGQQPPSPLDSGAAADRPPPLTRPGQDSDPLGALAKSDNDSDKDDAATDSRGPGLVVAPKQMSSALGSLVANYGSLSESESDDGAHVSTMQRTAELLQENKVLLKQDAQPSSISHSWSARNSPNNPRGRGGRGGRGGRHGRGGHNDMLQKRRPTLLEMLLAPDIRHERNILLQCVRYVVQSNFFKTKVQPEVKPGTDTRQEVTNGKPSEEVRTLSASSVAGERCL
uniref:nuclear fragile X mental retardation-interacting protein 1 n=1 Tax=Doryrhamphus excisus TaxID=161450 RepID=UPI0025AEB36F|nr:nuclear fragile X mental retardation-interacting protein 1 [Doryrhamphus excisus]